MSEDAMVRTIDTRIHGRYLVRTPAITGPWPLLVGFHGYGEDAAASLLALERIRGTHEWLIVAVQALHPFYTKSDRIVASWMTRQDRELAMSDNIEYIRRVIGSVRSEFPVDGSKIVFAGFSQGGAMAYRAAANFSAAGLIILAADLPPDLQPPARLPHLLLGRGTADAWYTATKLEADVARLPELTTLVDTCTFEGGHEWADAFVHRAADFLTRIRGDSRAL